jgi:4-alpha-glucanotransferase
MYDMIRIDHFRGFDTYWDIPAGSDTAEGGQWKPGPGRDLFQVLLNNDNRNKIIAEDLGDYSETVEKLRDDLSFPGMRVMQFAFGEGKGNPHNPHLHTANSVVYTGTHDNDTLAGWLKGLQKEEKSLIASYLGCRESELFHSVIRAAVSSVARLCVLPMQDMLKMGSESRMNIPGTTEGNWKWRMPGDYAESVTVKTVSEMIKIYERLL